MENKRILWAVIMTCFLGPFMASSINVAVPAMVITFNSTPEAMTWAVTAFLIGSASTLLWFGSMADLKGRRKIYYYGLIATCITTFIAGSITSYYTFIIWRFIQGVAMSMIFGTGMALLVSCYPKEKRGQIIGLASGFVYIGLSVGPFLGGLICDYLSWHYIFYFTGIAILANIILMMGIKDEWYGTPGKFDYLGGSISIILIFLFLYTVATWSTNPYNYLLLMAIIILTGTFIFQQSRGHDPLINLQLFTNPLFSLANLAALIHYSATFAISFLISLYLQYNRGLDATSTGLFLLIQPGFMAILSPYTGSLSDKYPPRYLAALGMMLMGLGLGYFHFYLDHNTSYRALIITLSIIGMGFALFAAPNNNTIMSAVQPAFYGIASSILAVVRVIGQALSMGFVTSYLARALTGVSQEFYSSTLLMAVKFIFLIFALLCILGLMASLYKPSQSISK